MIKVAFCLHRLPHMSRQDFQRYWFDVHAPLVQKNQKAMRVQRYVQLHYSDLGRLSEGVRKVRGAPEPFDGVAELWFERAEDLEAAFATPEGRAAGAELLQDEKRFIDLARSPILLGVEKRIIEGEGLE